MATLQNQLDLKTSFIVIPNETYELLIFGILRPLCLAGTAFYNKILDRILVSDQETKKLSAIITKNYISAEKSIYSKISTIFFDLKMILRLYLNNCKIIANYKEC